RGLSPAHDVRNELVDVTEVPSEVAPDLRVVARLGQRPQPELGDGGALLLEVEKRVRHRLRPGTWVGLGRNCLVPRRADTKPGALDARQVERLLRGEVAIEDRLGHARLA